MVVTIFQRFGATSETPNPLLNMFNELEDHLRGSQIHYLCSTWRGEAPSPRGTKLSRHKYVGSFELWRNKVNGGKQRMENKRTWGK